MKSRKILFNLVAVVLLTSLPVKGHCLFVLGTGMTAATSGRISPALHGGLMFDSFAILGTSSGVTSPVYYHSAYQLSVLGIWDPGKFIWGRWYGGFGLGGYLGVKGYRPSLGASTPQRHYDVAIGPTFRVQWDFLGPIYIAVDGLYGLRSPWLHLLLSFQDLASLTVGIHI